MPKRDLMFSIQFCRDGIIPIIGGEIALEMSRLIALYSMEIIEMIGYGVSASSSSQFGWLSSSDQENGRGNGEGWLSSNIVAYFFH